MNDIIDISKLNRAAVLAALYNNSKQQGMGFLHARGDHAMTQEQAQMEIDAMGEDRLYFDYLHGRVMKVDIGQDELDAWGYDRDNGHGAARRALQNLLSEQSIS